MPPRRPSGRTAKNRDIGPQFYLNLHALHHDWTQMYPLLFRRPNSFATSSCPLAALPQCGHFAMSMFGMQGHDWAAL